MTLLSELKFADLPPLSEFPYVDLTTVTVMTAIEIAPTVIANRGVLDLLATAEEAYVRAKLAEAVAAEGPLRTADLGLPPYNLTSLGRVALNRA